ncbi:MAG: transposase, partial [Cyanobacteria bacterium J06636_16]
LFNEAITLAQDFAQMLRERQSEDFDSWLNRAMEGNLPALARFAEGLKEDYEAVKAGLILPWSNGPVEGQINRLKMLKRQMYGRASLDLLSNRFILAD